MMSFNKFFQMYEIYAQGILHVFSVSISVGDIA